MNVKEQYYENVAETVIKNLKKRQMEGYYCATAKEAVEKVLSLMPETSSIGWGGSMTLGETGLMEAVKNGNYNVYERELAKTKEEQKAMYADILNCDYFLMSTNAITLDGQLVNIDGRGNRVSFLCYGPENVIILTGLNKLVPDVESAVKRVRNVATPQNTIRLNKKTPCAATGVCADCLSSDCICAQVVVTRFSMVPGRIKVILVGEELGY